MRPKSKLPRSDEFLVTMTSSLHRLISSFLIGLWLGCWPHICLSFHLQSCRPVATSLSATRLRCADDNAESQTALDGTSAILRLSYDGTRFTGWSAANDGVIQDNMIDPQTKGSKRKRRRHAVNAVPLPKGFVRSVEGVIRENLACIYGNVDPRRIVVEGCSRTDRGVHATGMIAQIYCFKESVLNQQINGNDDATSIFCSIPGKRLPHPTSAYDCSYFVPLPMGGNLSRLAFALNRMRPSDIQVTGIAPVPDMPDSSTLPFHPTLSSQTKRYEYRLSVGAFPDPLMSRLAWYIGPDLNLERVRQGCQILVGNHNFAAFQGVPPGPKEKIKYRQDLQSSDANRCTLRFVNFEEDPAPSSAYFLGVSPAIRSYRVVIEGDRFLYKMVRFLVGALVAVGTGKLDCDDLQQALQNQSWEIAGQEPRRKEFQCAPAHGLVLSSVDYGSLEFDWKPLRD